mgnify:CR=1 FL=1
MHTPADPFGGVEHDIGLIGEGITQDPDPYPIHDQIGAGEIAESHRKGIGGDIRHVLCFHQREIHQGGLLAKRCGRLPQIFAGRGFDFADGGVTQRDVSNNLLVSLTSSSLVSPSYFLTPANNVNYFVAVRQPVEAVQSVDDLMALPVSQPMVTQPTSVANQFSATQYSTFPNAPVTRMSDIASVRPRSALAAINHYSVQRVIDVAANADGRDLGGISADVRSRLSSSSTVINHINLIPEM